MKKFSVEEIKFATESIHDWAELNPKNTNWPCVYLLSSDSAVYVGETLSAASRLEQHINSGQKLGLSAAHIILDETFNKSACLDLESSLIRWFAGDAKSKRIRNRNLGVFDYDYFDRDQYQKVFRQIQSELKALNFFSQTVDEIENSDLFKFSPYKSLNKEQLVELKKLLNRLSRDLASGEKGQSYIVSGGPGTGKTIFALFLAKYLADLNLETDLRPDEDIRDTQFGFLWTQAEREVLRNLKVGLVIPLQALRKTITKVVKKTTALTSVDVLAPFEVGESKFKYDVLIVDETHRLMRRGSASSASLNIKWQTINKKLFKVDDPFKTQLDWINAKSRFQILVLDINQAVVGADLDESLLVKLTKEAKVGKRLFQLKSQMRVRGGDDYIEKIRAWVSGENVGKVNFGAKSEVYDFRIFENIDEMVALVRKRNEEFGLARLVAGYDWKWVSKKDPEKFDIEIGNAKLRWNSAKSIDWVTSDKSGASEEVGSIHTVQGYDLNYAGVIIGPDLKWDTNSKQMVFDRANYFDSRGMQNLPRIGVELTDKDLLKYVQNIYTVLLTRGIRGTYVYICDPALRAHLRSSISF
jgi:uncharacterized protein